MSLRARLLSPGNAVEAQRVWSELHVRTQREPVEPLTLALVLLLVDAVERGHYAHSEVLELARQALAHDLAAAADEEPATPREGSR